MPSTQTDQSVCSRPGPKGISLGSSNGDSYTFTSYFDSLASYSMFVCRCGLGFAPEFSVQSLRGISYPFVYHKLVDGRFRDTLFVGIVHRIMLTDITFSFENEETCDPSKTAASRMKELPNTSAVAPLEISDQNNDVYSFVFEANPFIN